MEVLTNARILANYIEELEDFKRFSKQSFTYNHIGALFTDCILQAGLNYNSIVKPRVINVLENFPLANTVEGLRRCIVREGSEKILHWIHYEKNLRFRDLTEFVYSEGINTESDLKEWLLIETNKDKLKSVRGIGPKTIDYMCKLLGLESVAVDRHIYSFVNEAGIFKTDYYEVKNIVEYAADLLNISRSSMDQSI